MVYAPVCPVLIMHTAQDYGISIDQITPSRYRVVYGLEVTEHEGWEAAAKAVGVCLLHSLECAGLIDRSEEARAMRVYLHTSEDLKWLKDVHGITCQAAMLYGNEDAPDRCEAYRVPSPMIWDQPDVYVRDAATGKLTNEHSGIIQ